MIILLVRRIISSHEDSYNTSAILYRNLKNLINVLRKLTQYGEKFEIVALRTCLKKDQAAAAREAATESDILFMSEPFQSEELKVVSAFPVFSKVRHHLTHDTDKLETMPRTGRGEGNLGVLGMQIDNEVAIRGVGKHTGGKAHGWAASKRKIAAGKGVQYLFIFPRRLCEKGVWVARLLKVMIFGQLESRDPKHRKTIKAAFWD